MGYKTVKEKAEGFYDEKRSRFIAQIVNVTSSGEAENFIASVRTTHRDARHTVFSYILREGGGRYSDDGEPHGTAGKPITDILVGAGLTDVCLTVTRYFGGVLLGTGGLVRAYGAAAKDALQNAKTVNMKAGKTYSVSCEYSQYDIINRLAADFGGTVIDSSFAEKVTVVIRLPLSNAEPFCSSLNERFNSSLSAQFLEDCFTEEA